MFSVPEFEAALLLILLVAAIEAWRLRHAGPNLALLELRVGSDQTSGEFLYILGRRSGLVAWIMSLFGLTSQTSFSVTDDDVMRETAGPWGFESCYAPLAEVSASRCSYYRAFWVLVLSLAFYLYGLLTLAIAMSRSNDYERQTAMAAASGTLWIGLICGTVCYIWYALSKRVVISVAARGDVSLGISFKRSVVENVGVDLSQTVEAVDLMNSQILLKHPGR